MKAEMEDYALQNALEGLGYAHYLEKGDVDQVRSLIDINLSNHLGYIAKYQGNNHAKGFDGAKIRTLNAIALLWDESPPENPFMNQTEVSQGWESILEENYVLLKWAKDQCANNPALGCKAHNKAPQPTQ